MAITCLIQGHHFKSFRGGPLALFFIKVTKHSLANLPTFLFTLHSKSRIKLKPWTMRAMALTAGGEALQVSHASDKMYSTFTCFLNLPVELRLKIFGPWSVSHVQFVSSSSPILAPSFWFLELGQIFQPFFFSAKSHARRPYEYTLEARSFSILRNSIEISISILKLTR